MYRANYRFSIRLLKILRWPYVRDGYNCLWLLFSVSGSQLKQDFLMLDTIIPLRPQGASGFHLQNILFSGYLLEKMEAPHAKVNREVKQVLSLPQINSIPALQQRPQTMNRGLLWTGDVSEKTEQCPNREAEDDVDDQSQEKPVFHKPKWQKERRLAPYNNKQRPNYWTRISNGRS